jgi:hypothetical protein
MSGEEKTQTSFTNSSVIFEIRLADNHSYRPTTEYMSYLLFIFYFCGTADLSLYTFQELATMDYIYWVKQTSHICKCLTEMILFTI